MQQRSLEKQIQDVLDLKILHSPRLLNFFAFFDSPWKIIATCANSALLSAKNIDQPHQLLNVYEDVLTIQDNLATLEWFNLSDEDKQKINDLAKHLNKAILDNVPATLLVSHINTCQNRMNNIDRHLQNPSKTDRPVLLQRNRNTLQKFITDLKLNALKRSISHELKEQSSVYRFVQNAEEQMVFNKKEKLNKLHQDYDTEKMIANHQHLVKQTQDLGLAALILSPFVVATFATITLYWQEFQLQHEKVTQQIRDNLAKSLDEKSAPAGYHPWMQHFLAHFHNIDSSKQISEIYDEFTQSRSNQELLPSI